jgi:hypothetical protein
MALTSLLRGVEATPRSPRLTNPALAGVQTHRLRLRLRHFMCTDWTAIEIDSHSGHSEGPVASGPPRMLV